MANTTSGGVYYIANNTAPTDPAADSLRVATSVDKKIIRPFGTTSDRNAANTSPTIGTHAYVTDSGLSVYDGNARSGTAGWSWVGPRILQNRQGILGASATAASDEITNSGNLVLDSKRMLHIVTSAKVWADTGNVLARVFMTGTNISLPPSDQQIDVGTPAWVAGTPSGSAYRQSVSFDCYVAAGPSTVASPVFISYRVLRVAGSNTNTAYAEATFQVVDMGPAD